MRNVIKSLWLKLNPVPNRRQHFGIYGHGEAHSGDWQRGLDRREPDDLLLFPYIFAALSLVSGDIGKLPLKLMQRTEDRLWVEVSNSAYSPVLKKFNKFQTRQEFVESWILSTLIHGNAYILKLKDKRGVVKELRVLDATRVTVLVSDANEVFYELAGDNLAGISGETVTVPASAVIHHKINTFFHPMMGISPIRAAAMAAGLGMNIQQNASYFFKNASRPGSILTAPGSISDTEAAAIKSAWQTKYNSRDGMGSVAILADGLTHSAIPAIHAADAQMIESLGWTGETVCSVFKIPKFKLQIGDLPSYDSVGSLSTVYYTDALQSLIEGAEALLTEGLGLPNDLAVEFDLDGLLRMDLASQIKSLSEAVGGGLLTINEARRALNRPAVNSGDVIFRQQQEWPIEQLANRRGGPDASAEQAKLFNIEYNKKVIDNHAQ